MNDYSGNENSKCYRELLLIILLILIIFLFVTKFGALKSFQGKSMNVDDDFHAFCDFESVIFHPATENRLILDVIYAIIQIFLSCI